MTCPLNYSPITVGSCVRYNQILCNTANEYNPSTGIFTVQTNGTYSISVSMMSGMLTSHLTLRKLGISSTYMVWLYTGTNYNMASQTINCELVVGDTMCVYAQSGSSLFSVYNTFTAVRIS